MRASIKTHNDGTVALNLDTEAARAVFTSVVFAAKFHQKFALLAKVAEKGLRREKYAATRRNAGERDVVCQ
jgi:hypothetical protein